MSPDSKVPQIILNGETIANPKSPLPPKKTNSFIKWIDSVYELFQEEPKTAEELDDNLTYEESQIRIINLASFLALSLGLIVTTLIGIRSWSPQQQILAK